MTVSPNRPQDGDRPFSAAGAESDDRLLLTALPPTLFELPNLNASIGKAPALHGDQPGTAENEVSPADEPQTGPDPDRSISRSTATASDRTTDIAPDSPSPVPRPRPPYDAPTGRGWMEKIGAHTLVLLMLVIVVAAALVTGKKQGDTPATDSLAADPIADTSEMELGDSDWDLASTELPIPSHVAAELDAAEPGIKLHSSTDSQPSRSSVALDAHSGVNASPASTRNYTDAAKLPIDSSPLSSEPALAGFNPGESIANWNQQPDLTDGVPAGPRFSQTPAGIDLNRYLPPSPTNE